MRGCNINENKPFAKETAARKQRICDIRGTQTLLQTTTARLRINNRPFFDARSFYSHFQGSILRQILRRDETGEDKVQLLELVAKGLEIKGVKNWYFGLYTALKLNNMTHEYFSIDYVVNDKMLRINPMKVSGHKFRFMKLKSSLLSFGAITKDGLSYSDPEKTILDFIYIWRYNGIPRDRIIADVGDWSINLSVSRLIEYAKNYPKTVQEITLEIAHNRKVLT